VLELCLCFVFVAYYSVHWISKCFGTCVNEVFFFFFNSVTVVICNITFALETYLTTSYKYEEAYRIGLFVFSIQWSNFLKKLCVAGVHF